MTPSRYTAEQLLAFATDFEVAGLTVQRTDDRDGWYITDRTHGIVFTKDGQWISWREIADTDVDRGRYVWADRDKAIMTAEWEGYER